MRVSLLGHECMLAKALHGCVQSLDGGVYVKLYISLYISANFVLKNAVLHTHFVDKPLTINVFTCVCKMCKMCM